MKSYRLDPSKLKEQMRNIYLMYGLIELMLNQSFVLNLLLNLMMNGYIVFIILMMKFQQKKNWKIVLRLVKSLLKLLMEK